MTILRTVSDVREALGAKDGIGFVPTMGAFHEGHLELMRRSVSECKSTVVSLFVNPLQFGPNEDYDKYHRDEGQDFRIASAVGVDYMFAPSAGEILLGQHSTVHVEGVTRSWEGESRPGHFDGVATIVLKLFNIVRPNVAYFGLKDLQQCAVVQTMVRDLNLDINIQLVNTVREPSGLALSSRNRRLTPHGLLISPALFRVLTEGLERIKHTTATVQEVVSECKSTLETTGFIVDYVALVDPETMSELDTPTTGSRMIAAVTLDSVRLIDNVGIDIE